MFSRTFVSGWVDSVNNVLHLDPRHCPAIAEQRALGVNVRRAGRRVRIDLVGYGYRPSILGADPCRSCTVAPVVVALLRNGLRNTTAMARSEFVEFNLEAPKGTSVHELGSEQRQYSDEHMREVTNAGNLVLSENSRGLFGYGFVDPAVASALAGIVRFREEAKAAVEENVEAETAEESPDARMAAAH